MADSGNIAMQAYTYAQAKPPKLLGSGSAPCQILIWNNTLC